MEQNNSLILTSKRAHLRTFEDSDLKHVFLGLSHPEVIKYYGVSYKSLEATKEQLLWFKNLEKNQIGIWWAICSKENNSFYGAIGFNNLEKEHKKVEIGFWLLPKYWGKGIMSECLPLVCDYAFTTLKLHRIEAFVETENSDCKKLLEKFSFTHEGTMRDCEIKNDTYISLDIYSKLKV